MLRHYVTLLHQHIDKENAVLFPFAERVMSAADDRRVLEAFAAVEEREGGQRARAALLDLGRAVERACRTDGRGAVRVPRTEDVMRRDVRAIGPGDSLARAVETMEGTGVRELPVVDGGVLVGVVALRDLRPHWGQYEWTAVREAMTPRPVTVAPETPIATVARLLLEHCFNAVPVVSDGTVVGMIARSDLLRLLAEVWPWSRGGRQPSHA
jgi:CBS domain-containing protein